MASAVLSFRVPETNSSTIQPAAEQTVQRINRLRSLIKICKPHLILKIKRRIGFQIIQIKNLRTKRWAFINEKSKFKILLLNSMYKIRMVCFRKTAFSLRAVPSSMKTKFQLRITKTSLQSKLIFKTWYIKDRFPKNAKLIRFQIKLRKWLKQR